MLFFLKLASAVIMAVTGALAGNIWIKKLYADKESILSFPHKISSQAKNRQRYLPGVLGMAFAFYLLTSSAGALTIILNLFFVYFLILFTITDLEQQVIFDAMLIPFGILGLFSCLAAESLLFNHLLAALGGGALFLILAILTRGGIGGGDIKLIAALGLWLGVHQLTDVVAMGLIAGGIGAFFLLKFAHKKRTDTFAYGPYFTIAALLQLFLG